MVGFLSVIRMLTWFSLIWSQFQFSVTIDYFLGKKHIEFIVMWMQEGRKWHFGKNQVCCRFRKYMLNDTFWAVYKSQLKVFTFLWTKQDVKKQWNTKKIWPENCSSCKMTKMHLRPSCIQLTLYALCIYPTGTRVAKKPIRHSNHSTHARSDECWIIPLRLHALL